MRAAIIGTGGIAHTHAQSIRSLGHSVSLVVGHTLPSAQRFAGEYGCECFTDTLTEEQLKKVDCVHVCAPPERHYELVKLCLESGKHVLCEKPLSLRYEDAKELSALAEAKGVAAAVDFNNRFYPTCTQVRGLVAEMGDPVLIHGHYQQEFNILPCPYSWRYREATRATSEIGSHFIDLMRYLTGLEVEAVSAVFQTLQPEGRVRDGLLYPDGEGEAVTVSNEDTAVVTFRLSGGAVASAVFSEISPGRSNDLSLEILSASRSVSWCSESPYQVVTGEKAKGLTCRTSAFGGGFTDTFTDCFRAFYCAVETGLRDPRLATFRDGAVNTLICSCIAQSAHNGGTFVPVRE